MSVEYKRIPGPEIIVRTEYSQTMDETKARTQATQTRLMKGQNAGNVEPEKKPVVRRPHEIKTHVLRSDVAIICYCWFERDLTNPGKCIFGIRQVLGNNDSTTQ